MTSSLSPWAFLRAVHKGNDREVWHVGDFSEVARMLVEVTISFRHVVLDTSTCTGFHLFVCPIFVTSEVDPIGWTGIGAT